ncbi:ACP S-malonyltransferase [Aquibacillus sediminis]|uniref:ACP S-malonyltransferase n=1 Tax=Aquibacillus sediminis TaxID=2574734 RepID=UPI001107B7BE|nr:ACP S-malonyltransferase [Aquibacillus sediminis]
MKRVAFVFPGQGSQSIGMGKELYQHFPIATKLFDQADQLLETSLTTLMFEGPDQELTHTANAQPALLLTSVAINNILNEHGIFPTVTAGHSLGEYSALVASNALTFQEALPLVRKRGQLMEQAYPKGKGTMAAVLGLDSDEIQRTLDQVNQQDEEMVDIANMNCPGQVVISGTVQGIDKATALLKENGVKRVLPLNVSGPFHSRLMKPAAEQFAEQLDNVNVNNADIPIYANVTADRVSTNEEIADLLVKQLYSPVRFEETIEKLIADDLDAIVEVGNGKVLTGLVKKVNRRTKTFTVQDPESIDKFIKWYKEEA